MPVKPNKVQGAGVAVFADGGILTRLQSVTADTDLGVEEIREISNSSVVEFVEGTPTVSIQMEANQNGSRSNLAYLTGQDGTLIQGMINPLKKVGSQAANEITVFSFEGNTVDLVAQLEEDSTLKRSMYMPDCFVTALSWNFDVGGVATESYSLESDDKRMYVGTQRELMVTSGYYTGAGATGTSGIFITTHPELLINNYFVRSGYNGVMLAAQAWSPIEASLNGQVVVQNHNGAPAEIFVPPLIITNDYIIFSGQAPGSVNAGGAAIGAGRWRTIGYKDSPNTSIFQTTDLDSGANGNREFTKPLGGIRKGMLQIFLVSGATYFPNFPAINANLEEYLRLQTCSIDVDLSREALEELGNAQAYERSLNFPISATVNFSALDSDIQAWAAFANLRAGYNDSTLTKVDFRQFLQQAGVLIKIFNDDESNVSRKHLMTFTVSGIRVASESFSVDAGGNAVQEFSCSADNFTIS